MAKKDEIAIFVCFATFTEVFYITFKLSFADAWIAATAILYASTLVHKDPEFEQLEDEIEILKLPYK